MNAAGRVSVSHAEITVNTGKMCPLWEAAAHRARRKDRQTKKQLVSDILIHR